MRVQEGEIVSMCDELTEMIRRLARGGDRINYGS